MDDVNKPSQALPSFQRSCPYLGLVRDPETRFSFPNRGNHCHRFSPSASVTLAYQSDLCLSGRYEQCLVYQDPSQANLVDGVELERHDIFASLGWNRIIALIITAIIVIFGGAFISIRLLSSIRMNSPQAGTATQEAILLSLSETAQFSTQTAPSATPIPTATLTPTSTSTPTPIPSPTLTPAPPTSGPDIGTPFGPNARYVLHRVVAGESLNNIAVKYETSNAVIAATNELTPGIFIQPDMVLVILPGVTDAAGLSVLHPVFLDQDASLSELSVLYDVSESDLREYNSLGEGDLIPGGRWIIVPSPTLAEQ